MFGLRGDIIVVDIIIEECSPLSTLFVAFLLAQKQKAIGWGTLNKFAKFCGQGHSPVMVEIMKYRPYVC